MRQLFDISALRSAVLMHEHEQKSVESPLMQIFGGKFRSTLRAPNQPDTVTTEAWLSLQLDIQVRFPSPYSTNVLVTEIENVQKHDLVHAIEDALARITHLQPVQLGPSGRGEASQQVFVEVLPPILVLHLKRFLYDSADGIVKVSKHVRFAPELEIPLGEIFSFVCPVLAKAQNPSCLGRSRNHGTRCWEIFGASALQAVWCALPPRRVRRQRTLYCRCAPPERSQWWWGGLVAHRR